MSDFSILYQFKVRKPYERYGAVAYFDDEYEIVGIWWCHGNKMVLPDDYDWNHAKWVWKTSFMCWITLQDHLFYSHLIEANALTLATMQTLPIDHPLRILIKPHTYRTTYINFSGSKLLIADYGLLHRMFAFDYDELIRVWNYGKLRYRFTLLPDYIHPSMRDVDQNVFGFYKDSLDFGG